MRTLNLFLLGGFLLASSVLSAQNARKFYKIGQEFLQSGNYKDAVTQLSRAIDMEPDMEKAYLARALAYERLDMLINAADDYDRAGTFLENKPEVFYNAGRLYYELKEYEKAIQRLDKAIALKKNYLEPYQVKTKVLIAQENYAGALREADLALTLKESSENYYYRGLVQIKLNNLDQAEKDLIASVSEDRKNVQAIRALADVRIQQGKIDFALQNINNAINIDPDNTEGYIIRSRAYVKKLDYPKAINDITTVILLNPENTELYYLRGVLYQDFTQHSNAINDFTRVLMAEPENARALYKRAWSYEQVQKYEEATKDYEALVGLSETDYQAQHMLKQAQERLFELYREEKRPEIVILEPEPREKQVLQFPKGARTAHFKGMLYDDSGIKELLIDGKVLEPTEVEDGWEFLVALDIENKEEVTIQATDVYDNTALARYTINLTEVDPPLISVNNPYPGDDGIINISPLDELLLVQGSIEDESLIESIIINGVLASYMPDELNPDFTAQLNILNQNKITVSVSDVFGNENVVEYRLNRDAAMNTETNPMGKTWAVFIENSEYETFASLDGPEMDIRQMKLALSRYQIHKIIPKRNMTKDEMEKFFSIELRDLVRRNKVNSLLIWYAGHGKVHNNVGYWIPVDAKRDEEYSYYSINAMRAALEVYNKDITHTLVVTDACESGPSFYQAMRSTNEIRSCDDWEATSLKSSQVFSSAGYELAVDNSQFTRTFVSTLASSPDACIPIELIVNKVTSAMVNNNQQSPKFGKIQGLEDENGTFFFIKKDYQ